MTSNTIIIPQIAGIVYDKKGRTAVESMNATDNPASIAPKAIFEVFFMKCKPRFNNKESSRRQDIRSNNQHKEE